MELSPLGFIDSQLSFTLYNKTTIFCMPTFHPFDSHRPSYILDKSISKELRKPGLPKVPSRDFPPGPYLRPFIKASGLTPEVLCERMQRSYGKTTITPELLEKALKDTNPEMWIICRIFKALHLSWDDYRLLKENHLRLQKEAELKYKQAKKLFLLYKNKGPRLHTLVRFGDWLESGIHLTSEHLMRQLDTGAKYAFNIPTPEEMSTIIAHQFESCIHPNLKHVDIATAFLYHRRPNEVHLYDTKGNILASGDTQITLSNGMTII